MRENIRHTGDDLSRRIGRQLYRNGSIENDCVKLYSETFIFENIFWKVIDEVEKEGNETNGIDIWI